VKLYYNFQCCFHFFCFAGCFFNELRNFHTVSIRDWPWWRLLVRVNPLLNVHRAEEKLKIASGELQTLRAKVEKLESDRSFLRDENESLEGKVSDRQIACKRVSVGVRRLLSVRSENKNRKLSPVDFSLTLLLLLTHRLRVFLDEHDFHSIHTY
jgi:hypothetical protein